jgi:amino acid transporter
VAAEAITSVIGLLLGQIRTLQKLGWLANAAVWLNIIVIIMTMVVVHKYPPNYEAAETANNVKEGPIVTSANWPEGLKLNDYMGGVMNCVYAYGGAILFNELMAEMRKP